MNTISETDAAPQAPIRTPKGWKRVGWQGVTANTPDAWNLAAYGGDARVGNIRIDNGETAGNAVMGVEIRWSRPKKALSAADLEKRLDQYLTSVDKGAKKQKLSADTKSKPLEDRRFPVRTARSFHWRVDRKGVGRIWHCAECGRLMIAQVVGAAKGDFQHLAHDVLASLECHSADPAWRPWSLYDLHTEVPADFTLKGKPQLLNIYVQLAFERAGTTDLVTVEQWGVASVQLRNAYLDEWFQEKNSAQESSLRYQSEETTIHGHTALAMTGRRWGLTYWGAQAIPQLTRLQLPAIHYAARIWECPETNKIFLIQSYTRRLDPTLVDRIVERTVCHPVPEEAS
ncbi:hypothetical protein CCAX7_40100 [Capsulimonas corticalis]|uniref:Uncharacterized protein n=1 Tax=Capsulimonas corticalis TaxID=2219043 RepID=A0A9N7QBB6_9BACT|nr:hypothetical protein [Capsulimonas corticalis]BDI31959.1 hypothetical protein CCAX7_40100 [Capsulimonas corticalis]